MKTTCKGILGRVVIILILGLTSTQAQQVPDSVVALAADAQGLAYVAAQNRLIGTYWEVHNSLPCVQLPWPFPPADPNIGVWAIGWDQFLVDSTAGPLIQPLRRPYSGRVLSTADYASIIQVQVEELQTFVSEVQTQQLARASRNSARNGLTGNLPPLPNGEGGEGGDDSGGTTNSPPLWTTNFTDLILEMVSASPKPSGLGHLLLHNSRAGQAYRLWSATSITNAWPGGWTKERLFLGAEDATNTPVWVFIESRTNQLYFRAELASTNSYTAIVRLAGTSTTADAFVNGVSNQYNAFTETLVGFSGVIGSLNLGLGNIDWTGPRWFNNLDFTADLPFHSPWVEPPYRDEPGYSEPFPSEDSRFPDFLKVGGAEPTFGAHNTPLPVAEVAFSAGTLASMTNLFLDNNSTLDAVDLHDASALQLIEAYGCDNLKYVRIGGTNLWRANIEAHDTSSSSLSGALDFSDCPSLQEIRCANHPGVTQVVFPTNGLPNLWHLCLHDCGLATNLDLSGLSALAELFIGHCNQRGSLDATTLPSTSLYDVRCLSNSYVNIDFAEKQPHLYRLIAYQNLLTNVALSGCTNLSEVDLRNNRLYTNAIGEVIAALCANTNSGRCPRVLWLQGQADGATMSAAGYNNFIQLAAYATNYWSTHGNYTGPGDVSFIADIPEAFVPPSILSVTARALDATTEAVTWTTSVETTNNMIDYGTTTNYGSSVTADGSTTHSNNLSGLSTGTNYFYQVRSTATTNGLSATNTGSFVAGYVPTWACEQVVSTNAGWPDTTLEMTLTTETNNLLVAYVHGSSPPSAPSGWSTVTNASCGTGGYIGLYYKENCAGGATTVSAYGLSLHVLEFSGAAASGALDVYASVPDASATTLPSVSLPTLNSTNELVVAGLACYASPIYPGAGYTGQENAGFVEYRLGVTNTSVTATATFTTSQTYGMIGAAFKPAN